MKIINGKIYDSNKKEFATGQLALEQLIGNDETGEILNAEGCYVVPGYIDNHTHGRGGIDVMENLSADDFKELALSYARGGTTTVFPTVMTNPEKNIKRSIKAIAENAPNCPISFDGVHIEGPYISKNAPGCHILEYIMPLTETDTVGEFIAAAGKLRVHITVSPESEGGESFIKYCVSKGATVGIGHSTATYAQCSDALSWGCVSFTHTFNAMKALSHREPGTVGASLISDAYSEFICDGFHISPEVIGLGYKTKGEDKFVIVTDSLPPAGMPDGRYSLAGMPVNVNGKCILTDSGTIAGSGIDMHSSVLNLMSFANIPYEKALACATVNAAKQTGIYDICGSLENGKRADILLVDEKTLQIKTVIAKGKIILS